MDDAQIQMTVTQASPLRVIADGADTDSVAAKTGSDTYLLGDRVQATLRTPLPPLVTGKVTPP